jgi:hypothetical protein
MNIAGYLRYYGGILLVAFGIFLTFGGVVQLNEGRETWQSFITLVFFVGFLPVVVGTWMIYTAKKNAAETRLKKHENEVLQLAMKFGGHISTAQVAMNTSLSTSQADKLLNRMQEQGLFILKISESGMIMYQVVGIMGRDEKLLDV